MSSTSNPIRTKDVDWRVVRADPDFSSLPPITLGAHRGGFSLVDFLTPTQARDIGARLMALALEVEAEDAETEHFDKLDSEGEAAAEARMRADGETSLALAVSALPLIDAALGAESPAEAA